MAFSMQRKRLLYSAWGLGCLLAWVNILFAPTPLQLSFDVYLANEILYACSILSTGIALATTVVARRQLSVRSRLVTSTLLMTIPPFTRFVPPLSHNFEIACLASILEGIGWSFLATAWNGSLSETSFKESASSVIAGVSLGVALTIPFPTESQLANYVLLCLLPASSVTALRLHLATTSKHASRLDTLDNLSKKPLSQSDKRLPLLLARMAIYAVLISIASRLLRISFVFLGKASDPASISMASDIASLCFVALSVAYIAIASRPSAKSFNLLFWRRVSFFALAGCAALVPVAIFAPSFAYYFFINDMSYQIVQICLWVTALSFASYDKSFANKSYCLCIASLCLGLSLGTASEPVLLGLMLNDGSFPCFASLAATMMIAAANIFAFPERHALYLQGKYFPERKLSFRDKCALASDRFKLTQRESEVLALLATGRDSGHIQEALCLSKSTVSTHREHIYQKMNVHSKQELIDAVEGIEPDA